MIDSEELLLSDIQIMRRLVEEDEQCIFVSPLVNPAVQIGPSSLDVHLGVEIKIPITADETHIDLTKMDRSAGRGKKTSQFRVRRVGVDGAFVLHPGEFTLASTLEFIRLPRDIAARLEGRSSLARLGVSVHTTAGFVDPGFEGQLTFELTNVSKLPVRLEPGLRLAQLCFFKISACQVPYDVRKHSKYSGAFGPVLSKIAEDSEFGRNRTSIT